MRAEVPRYVRLLANTPGVVEWATEGLEFVDGGEADGVLREFVRMEGKPDAVFPTFIHRWGPLGTCRHRLPFTHARECVPAPVVEAGLSASHADPDGHGPVVPQLHWMRERTSDWQAVARDLQLALDCACQLSRGLVPPESALPGGSIGLTGMQGTAVYRGSTPGERAEEARQCLGEALRTWRQWAGVEPVLRWQPPGPPRWQWGMRRPQADGRTVPVPSLFATLVLQLQDAVAEELRECSSCGHAFPAWRGLEGEQARYCGQSGCARTRQALAA